MAGDDKPYGTAVMAKMMCFMAWLFDRTGKKRLAGQTREKKKMKAGPG